MLTKQQIFDTVATHLLTQNAKSVGKLKRYFGCLYRGPNGRKCAAGCLIPDEVYKPEFEASGIGVATIAYALQAADIVADRSQEQYLLIKLQNLHDCYDCEDWPLHLTRIGDRYELDTTVVTSFKRS